jgi:Tfp pilus assembly protein PilF
MLPRRRIRLGGMAAWLGTVLLGAGLGGCLTATQERVRDFTEDGVYLYQRGDYLHARQSFDAALRLQEKDPALLYNIGCCYDRVGAAAKAEEYYKLCLVESPNHPECRHAMTLLLMRERRRQEADDLIDDWLAREPKLSAAYVEDAWRRRQDGDPLQAQGRLQQALDLDPHNARAMVELALVYELMDYKERALVLYEQALRLDPRQPEVAQRLELLRTQGVKRPLPD